MHASARPPVPGLRGYSPPASERYASARDVGAPMLTLDVETHQNTTVSPQTPPGHKAVVGGRRAVRARQHPHKAVKKAPSPQHAPPAPAKAHVDKFTTPRRGVVVVVVVDTAADQSSSQRASTSKHSAAAHFEDDRSLQRAKSHEPLRRPAHACPAKQARRPQTYEARRAQQPADATAADAADAPPDDADCGGGVVARMRRRATGDGEAKDSKGDAVRTGRPPARHERQEQRPQERARQRANEADEILNDDGDDDAHRSHDAHRAHDAAARPAPQRVASQRFVEVPRFVFDEAPAQRRASAAGGMVVVRDEARARANDAILHQRVAEARGRRHSALHQKPAAQPDGAVIYQFALWGRKTREPKQVSPKREADGPSTPGKDRPPRLYLAASPGDEASVLDEIGDVDVDTLQGSEVESDDAGLSRASSTSTLATHQPLEDIRVATPVEQPRVLRGREAPNTFNSAAAVVADSVVSSERRARRVVPAIAMHVGAVARSFAHRATAAASGRPLNQTHSMASSDDSRHVPSDDAEKTLRRRGAAPAKRSAVSAKTAETAQPASTPRARPQPSLSSPVHPAVALARQNRTERRERKDVEAAWREAEPVSPPRAPGTAATPQPTQWKCGERLGEGSFGVVYLALNTRTGELFACKQIALSPDAPASEVADLATEIRLLKAMEHAHVVRYLGTEMRQSEGLMYLFMEYVPGGSIASMLAQFGVFAEELIRIYLAQILNGVAYLHERKIIHRDIKGANVLVSESGVAKLADFGCSKQLAGMRTGTLEQSLQAIQGSVPWMAPEVIKQSGHGRSADVWSVGATVIEMATAHHPWPAFSNNLTALFQIATSTEPPCVRPFSSLVPESKTRFLDPSPRTENRRPTPDTLSSSAAALISRCLVIDPKGRANAQELLRDPFITARPSYGS